MHHAVGRYYLTVVEAICESSAIGEGSLVVSDQPAGDLAMTELWATQPSPEEVIRYAGRCLDSVLEMHGVIPPLDGPQVTPDDQGNYRVSYETQTLRVEATFTGTIRAGTIGVHRLETPHWKQGTPTSIDRFGGYDPAIPGKPQHLGRGTLAIELVTVPAISR